MDFFKILNTAGAVLAWIIFEHRAENIDSGRL